MARHTLRGRLSTLEVKRLITDDGVTTHGHRILAFYLWPSDSNSVQGVLGLDYDITHIPNAGDNRQVAWAGADTQSFAPFNIIDPDHIVIQDLYISATHGGGGEINYLVVLEPVHLSEDEAVLQLIKERSQDDLR